MDSTARNDNRSLLSELPELSGVFGPPAVIPLVSDLLSPALLDAMTLGFARWAGNSSGLVQNDGHVFPEFGRRAERTFCSYCTVVHHTRRGRERCGSADCGGVKLLAGVPLEAAEAASIEQAESRTGKVVCYYCHAGLLEMLAPVRLYLGKFGESESVVIAALLSGQFRRRGLAEVQPLLDELAHDAGLACDDLATHYKQIGQLDDRLLREKEQNLAQTAEKISRAATEVFQTRERDRAEAVVRAFTGALTTTLPAGNDRAPQEQTPVRMLQRAMEIVNNEYDVCCTLLYRLEPKSRSRPVAASLVAGIPLFNTGIVLAKETRFRNVAKLWEAERGPVVCPAADDPLIVNILHSVGLNADEAAVVAIAFSTRRGGNYLWVTAESGAGWQIRRRGLQPAFALLLRVAAERIAACLDDVAPN